MHLKCIFGQLLHLTFFAEQSDPYSNFLRPALLKQESLRKSTKKYQMGAKATSIINRSFVASASLDCLLLHKTAIKGLYETRMQ